MMLIIIAIIVACVVTWATNRCCVLSEFNADRKRKQRNLTDKQISDRLEFLKERIAPNIPWIPGEVYWTTPFRPPNLHIGDPQIKEKIKTVLLEVMMRFDLRSRPAITFEWWRDFPDEAGYFVHGPDGAMIGIILHEALSHEQMIATCFHECAHAFLWERGVYYENGIYDAVGGWNEEVIEKVVVEENEILTDLTVGLLGYADELRAGYYLSSHKKYTPAGCSEGGLTKTGRHTRLGYVTPITMHKAKQFLQQKIPNYRDNSLVGGKIMWAFDDFLESWLRL